MELKPIDDNPQVQSLTTALRNICREYPAGGTVLRELLQNADDAGATELRFVLDEQIHPALNLIHPKLAQYQGPALLAYNNALFTDRDFESITRIGDSLKIDDGTTTGRFGRGFNSVYNWTDSPSIVSRERLYILDPHLEWSEKGGPMYDFVANAQNPAMKNQMMAFEAVTERVDKPLDGTVIRIPLRTPDRAVFSEISKRAVTASEIAKVLEIFAANFADNGLIFLRNIEKLEIQLDNESISIEVANREAIRQQKQKVNAAVKHALQHPEYRFDHSFQTEIIYQSPEKSRKAAFAIQHKIHGGAMDRKLQNWSAGQKFVPWVAIAAQLPLRPAEMTQGFLFTVLPLPISNSQPVHIHGLFSLSPDRARLFQLNDRSNQDKQPAEWNEFLLKNAVPAAWANLLGYLAELYPDAAAFPRWPQDMNNEHEPLSCATEKVIAIIARDSLALWPTHTGYVAAKDGLLATGEESEQFKDALKEAKVPVVCVPQQLLERAKIIFRERILSAETLSRFLKDGSVQVSSLNDQAKLQIIEYLLLETGFTGYDGLDIFPFKNGAFGSIGSRVAFVHRDKYEDDLFAHDDCNTIDLDKLSIEARRSLKDGCAKGRTHSSIHFRSAKVFREYSLSNVLSNISWDEDVATLSKEQAEFITKSRKWILDRKIDILDPDISDLWLLPLSNMKHRKVKPRKPGSHIHIATASGVGDLMWKFDNKLAHKSLPLLDTRPSGLTPQFLSALVGDPRISSQLALHDAGKLPIFLAWLHATSVIDEHVVDEDRNRVAEVIATQLPQTLSSGMMQSIRQPLQELKIFQKVSWKEGDESKRSWTSLNSSDKSVGLLESLRLVPTIPGTQFLLANWGTPQKDLLQNLKLADCLGTVQIIEDHIIPSWLRGDDSAWTDRCKEQISEFILRHFSSLTSASQAKLQTLPIVPVARLDGKDTSKFAGASELIDPDVLALKALYFNDEEVLPKRNFFVQFKVALRECGLKKEVDETLVKQRVRCYAEFNYPVLDIQKRAETLLKSQCCWKSPIESFGGSELRRLEWLPVIKPDEEKALMAAHGCRAQRDLQLVSSQLPLLTVRISLEWGQRLGLDQVLPSRILLGQLKFGIEKNDQAIVNIVLAYMFQHVPKAEAPALLAELRKLPFVVARNGSASCFVSPSISFCPSLVPKESCNRLYPYCVQVDEKFWRQHEKLLQAVGIVKFGLKDLFTVQLALEAKGALEEFDVLVAIRLLDLASKYPRDSLGELKVVSEAGKLVPIQDVNYQEPGSPLRPKEEVFLAHPDISRRIIRDLQIVSLKDRVINGLLAIEDVDEEDEFDQRESRTTRIIDTLYRYPIETTFKEYLANADDAEGASKISWMFDGRKHSTNHLLTENMKHFQGPALLVHNDAVFSEKDFQGFKNVGQGSKSEDSGAIGQFGRGSQTMYHWTDVPMILSGKYLVILDPQREFLPRNQSTGQRKPGMKMELSKLKSTFMGQLAPFEGLWHYTQGLDNYPGTIFRFPLRKESSKSIMGKNTKYFNKDDISKMIESYFNEARISLLFLRRIRSINFNVHGQPTLWSVARSDPIGEDEKSFSEAVVCSFSKRTNNATQITGEEKWWVTIEDLTDLDSKLLPDTSRRVMKNVECGIAGLISSRIKGPESEVSLLSPPQLKMFNTLPLPLLSDLPVHIHATFSLSGDRQSIAIDAEDMKSQGSKWNRHLLRERLPELYLAFLAGVGNNFHERVFDYWPQTQPPKRSCAELLCAGLWKELPNSSERVFPKALPGQGLSRRHRPQLFSIKEAVFDLLERNLSDRLAPLLQCLETRLVHHVPEELAKHLRTVTDLNLVDGQMLRRHLKSENGKKCLKEHIKEGNSVMDLLLPLLIPSNADIQDLDGCHILPVVDGTLGTLKLVDPNQDSQLTYFVATIDETEIFDFASRHLVPHTISRKLGSVLKSEKFNLTPLKLQHVMKLLELRQDVANPDQKADRWLENFWTYWNKSSDSILQPYNLDSRTFRATLDGVATYYTPKDFARLPAVVKPTAKEHQQLCERFPGLFIFDSALMPKSLSQSETSLADVNSFSRFVRALKVLAGGQSGIESLVRSHAEPTELQLLRSLVLKHVSDINTPGRGPKLLPDLCNDLKCIPIWYSFRTSELLASKDVLKPVDSRFLVPWMKQSGRFINSGGLNTNDANCLTILGAQKVSREELLKSYVLPLPSTLSEADRNSFLALLGVISGLSGSSDLSQSMISILSQAQLAFDGNSALKKASELFDHEDQIFLAAFRNEPQNVFLVESLRKYRPFWLKVGLRHRLFNSSQFNSAVDYLRCLQALELRINAQQPAADPHLDQDCLQVLTPLTTSSYMTRGFSRQDWSSISQLKVFRANRNIQNEPQYRQPDMVSLATSNHSLSLAEVVSYDKSSICWSQTPFPLVGPTSEVLANISGYGMPKLLMVCNHLEHLARMAPSLKHNEIFHFVQDLSQTYDYLQDHSGEVMAFFKNQKMSVWLNVNKFDHQLLLLDDVKSAWYSVDELVLSSSCDAGPIKAVKSGLMKYEKLLRALGCNSITYPTVPSPETQTGYSMTDSFQKLRKECKMLDISYTSEGQTIQAHKLVLAAASEFCEIQFSGRWSVGSELKYDKTTDGADFLSFHTLSCMINFAYEGSIDWEAMQVKDADTIEDRAAKLDLLLDLCKGTDYWLMPTLQSQVERRILDAGKLVINLDNVVAIQKRASEANARYVEQMCTQFISQNQDAVNKAYSAAGR